MIKRAPELPFFACRAFEVARLTREQLDVLQAAEKEKALGCLYPAAIQQLFGLGSLKKHYAVPSGTSHRDRAAGDHWRQCITQIIDARLTAGFNPPAICLQVDQIESVHEFDERIFSAVKSGRINFTFDSTPVPPRPDYDPDLYHPGRSSRLLQTDRLTAAGEGYPEGAMS